MEATFKIQAESFPGFYETRYSESNILSYMKGVLEYEYGEISQYDDGWDMPADYEAKVVEEYTKSYCDAVSSLLGLKMEWLSSDVWSPKYYNFENDRAYFTVKVEDTDKFFKRIAKLMRENYEELKLIIAGNHTSYDGFISFMENDIDEWFTLVPDLSSTLYVSCIIAYLASIRLADINDSKCLRRQIDEYIEMEVAENTDYFAPEPQTEAAIEEWQRLKCEYDEAKRRLEMSRIRPNLFDVAGVEI